MDAHQPTVKLQVLDNKDLAHQLIHPTQRQEYLYFSELNTNKEIFRHIIYKLIIVIPYSGNVWQRESLANLASCP